MRTIKFRAKVKMPEKRNFARQEYLPEGQWVYGEPHTIDCPTPHIHTADVGKQPIDKETICQFTGIKDGNGTEIFEGDIIEVTLRHNNTIVSTYNAIVDQKEGAFGFKNKQGFCPFYGQIHENYKVIGNIHDNPELMEGGAQ